MVGGPVSRRSTPVDAKHGVTSEYRAAQDRPGSEACEISGTGCSCLNDISCASKSIDGLVIFVLKVLIWIREPGTARRAAAVSRHGRAADPLRRIGAKIEEPESLKSGNP